MIMEFEAKFLKADTYRYTIDVSDDKIKWETVSEMKDPDLIVKGHTVAGNKMIGRFVRIKFDKPTPVPQITEVETYCTDVKEE